MSKWEAAWRALAEGLPAPAPDRVEAAGSVSNVSIVMEDEKQKGGTGGAAPKPDNVAVHDLRMFGDPVRLEISMAGAEVVAVRFLRGNDGCRRIVEGINRRLVGGVPVLRQQWGAIAATELLTELLNMQDRAGLAIRDRSRR